MKEIIKLIDTYWKFDEQQQPMSSWHDKQDLLKEVEAKLEPLINQEVERRIAETIAGKFIAVEIEKRI